MPLLCIVTLLAVATQGLPAPRLVYPRLLQERSAEGKMVLHIHDSLKLNLEKASIAAPEVHVHALEDGKPVEHLYKGNDINGYLYEDEQHLATVSLTHDRGSIQVEGLVGPHSRIAPLAEAERSSDGHAAHMIYEIEQRSGMDDTLPIETNGTSTHVDARYDGYSRATRVPDRVTIEVFFVADHAHQGRFRSREHLLNYICVLLNSVSLRYRTMKTPMVTLMLTGVEQGLSEPYWRGSGNYMYDSSTLRAFREYAVDKRQSYNWPDVIFLLTGRDLYGDRGSGKSAVGIAYVGGLCNSYLVGLGEDAAGYYTGVRTVAHEIGHVLGATHDGDGPEPNIPNHPSARSCSFNDGYLMSYLDKGAQRHYFSECSLRQMQFVISTKGQKCWKILSNRKCFNPNYPGMQITAIKFCERLFPGQRNVTAKMIYPKNNECKLRCQYPEISTYYHGNRGYTYTTLHYTDTTALDFYECGGGKVCVQGQCVFPPQGK